ncbi:unnamed protein product [Nippostrongylus brasiliensis]|uniref:Uncharacterized protein n=1 Tax=Nippostrongylus brasiliensis TaxID=27835 RepID=A0A0N4YKI7_NIPBR|nr:unnamed protein product [Nippostrongylus brasiliensis]
MWNPFSKGARDATFTIGDDDCVRQSLDEPYCNGILRANGPYKVKLRAYTNTNAAMESDWIAIDGTEEEVKEEEKKNQRRFPCHMYINGCPWESNANHESSVAVLLLTWLALL